MELPGRSWSGWAERLDAQHALSARWLWFVSLAAMMLMALRRMELFVRPDFYAEDLSFFYVQAYGAGWLHSFALTVGGYLPTIQRLLTGIALLLPFHLAPVADACTGLLLQTLPVPILLSTRCRNWGRLSTRLAFCFLYVFFPNGSEVHVVLTNSQWHFALAISLLAFGEIPQSKAGRVADCLLFALAGVCGPYGFVILPCLLGYWYVSGRQSWRLVQAAWLVPGVFVEAFVFMSDTTRSRAFLGASFRLLVELFGSGIVTATALGSHNFELALPFACAAVAAIAGALMLGYGSLYAPVPLRFFILLSALLTVAALHSPLVSTGGPLWQELLKTPYSRYWFFPGLCLLWCAAWAVRSARAPALRWLCGGYLVLASAGMLISYRYPPFPELHFQSTAIAFEAARPGTTITVHTYPDLQANIVKR